MSDSDATEIDSQLGDLAAYGREQELKFEKELLEEEAQQDIIIETEQQKQLKEKYSKYLTQKVYGKGAFGEVIEEYDIFQRKRYAKKTFARLEDYACEKNVLKKFDTLFAEEIPHILMRATKFDAREKSIYYESGNCSLSEYCEQKRKNKIFWWNNLDELNYIIVRMFELVKILYEKDVYHSDLKPVNLVLQESISKHFSLKLIDLGGATYAHHYLTAITQAYFPDMNQFNATENKENRIYAEFYQLGRIMQEILLSSIYSHSEKIFELDPRYQTYKLFLQEFFFTSNLKRTNDLLKQYYDKEYTDLVEMCLDMKSKVADIEKKVQNLTKNKKNEIIDVYSFVSFIEEEKVTKFFHQVDSQDQQKKTNIKNPEDLVTPSLLSELEFYARFEQNGRGFDKCQNTIKQMCVLYNQKQEKQITDPGQIHLELQNIMFQTQMQFSHPVFFMYQTIFGVRINYMNDLYLKQDIQNYITSYEEEEHEKYQQIMNLLHDKTVTEEFRLFFFNEVYCKYKSLHTVQFQDDSNFPKLFRLFKIQDSKDEYINLLKKKLNTTINAFVNCQYDTIQDLCKEYKQLLLKNKNNLDVVNKCINNILDIKTWYFIVGSMYFSTQPDFKQNAKDMLKESNELIMEYFNGEIKHCQGYFLYYFSKSLMMTLGMGDYNENLVEYEKFLLETEEFIRKFMPEQIQNDQGIFVGLLQTLIMLYQYQKVSLPQFNKWYESYVYCCVNFQINTTSVVPGQLLFADNQAFEYFKQLNYSLEKEGTEQEFEFYDKKLDKQNQAKAKSNEIIPFFHKIFYLKKIYRCIGDDEVLDKLSDKLKQRYKQNQDQLNEIEILKLTIQYQNCDKQKIQKEILPKIDKIVKNPNKLHKNYLQNLKNSCNYILENDYNILLKPLGYVGGDYWNQLREELNLSKNQELINKRKDQIQIISQKLKEKNSNQNNKIQQQQQQHQQQISKPVDNVVKNVKNNQQEIQNQHDQDQTLKKQKTQEQKQADQQIQNKQNQEQQIFENQNQQQENTHNIQKTQDNQQSLQNLKSTESLHQKSDIIKEDTKKKDRDSTSCCNIF